LRVQETEILILATRSNKYRFLNGDDIESLNLMRVRQ